MWRLIILLSSGCFFAFWGREVVNGLLREADQRMRRLSVLLSSIRLSASHPLTATMRQSTSIHKDVPMPIDPNVPHSDLTYRIIGAAMRVHNRLGPGLKEKHYQHALTAELRSDGMDVVEEYCMDIYDGSVWVGKIYIDNWVEKKVVVEIKALSHLLTNLEVSQVICYLAVTQSPVGLLINFGGKRLEHRRILPPKKFTEWKTHIQKFLWKPPEQK